jgi:hypothetical protein
MFAVMGAAAHCGDQASPSADGGATADAASVIDAADATLGADAALDASISDSAPEGGGVETPDAAGPLDAQAIDAGVGDAGDGDVTEAGAAEGGEGGAALDPRCTDGGTTTISGVVYDPAMMDPLYGVTVFVPDPASPLPAFARTGASCAACSDLYPATVNASAVTDATGHFTIAMTPGGQPVLAGDGVPLVVQIGKWRMQSTIGHVETCADNPQPDRALHLPVNSSQGDMPDIAISTGRADSLECLPLRIGVDPAEYTAGASSQGHIHIFQGAGGATTAPSAPASSEGLWDSIGDLQKNDAVLLSCEGAETSNMTTANQQSLSDYASAGGRVFASHFHYAWFNSGPFASDNLATWKPGDGFLDDTRSFPGNVTTLLNSSGDSGVTFPEGVAFASWLGTVGALTSGQLPIWFARSNAVVTPVNTASQPWLMFDGTVPAPGTNTTQYFSFDTPLGDGGRADGDAAAAPKCGRVVYSDLHVSGGPGINEPGVPPDYDGGVNRAITPSGCASHPLTPQEKALEFMLFDLSSCLQSIGSPPQVVTHPAPR